VMIVHRMRVRLMVIRRKMNVRKIVMVKRHVCAIAVVAMREHRYLANQIGNQQKSF